MTELNPEIENENLTQSKGILILVGSILLGILFNILFYEKIPAISCLIFVIAFYVLFYINFKNNMTLDFKTTNILLLFIFLLTATYGIYTNPFFMLLNILAIPLLIATHTILVTNKHHYSWFNFRFLNDLVYSVFHGAFAYIFKPIKIISTLMNIKTAGKNDTNLKKIVIGIIISLPILFIVVGLLSEADAVFQNLVSSFGNIFANLNIGSFISQFIIIVIISLLIFSYLWSLSIKKHTKDMNPILNASAIKRFIDPIILITVLTMICLVYSLFTFIQFTYLFGSLNLNLPKGFTYAEYARRGFWELLVVTLINLTILITNINFSEKKYAATDLAIRILNSFIILCTGVMLISAHFRMSLYEKVYGYTYLRFFTHAFMFYIFILLLVVLIKVWNEKLSLAKYYLTVSLIAFTLINYSQVDTIIAKRNIDRYHNTGKIDIYYLSNLSYEAVPQMVTLLAELKNKEPLLAARLENRLYNIKENLKYREGWQSFNFSANKTKKLLNQYNFVYDTSIEAARCIE